MLKKFKFEFLLSPNPIPESANISFAIGSSNVANIKFVPELLKIFLSIFDYSIPPTL